ncbi:MAG: hypothetical protein NE328_22595 [Lentisphaeraceae bacterium]|nr:hypothetical protein [Lentisphaeraceae bacterium]
MITISFMWVMTILQLKTAILGNAAWKLITRTPEKILKRSLEKIEIGDLDEEESEESNFLYNFTLSILSNFLLLFAEVGIGAYLLYEHHSDLSYYLAFVLLYKSLILFAIFTTFKVKNNGLSVFESLNLTPQWAVNVDRFSSFISAIIYGTIIWHRISYL